MGHVRAQQKDEEPVAAEKQSGNAAEKQSGQRSAERGNRSGHIPERHLLVERRAVCRRQLRRLARRSGRSQGAQARPADRPGGARQPDDARPPPPARTRPDQGRLGEGRRSGARAAAPSAVARQIQERQAPVGPRRRRRSRRRACGRTSSTSAMRSRASLTA